MAITAHPDDETLGCGGTLARYASEGVEVQVLSATRGEAGRHGQEQHPGYRALGKMREAELKKAARELGIAGVSFLGYRDGCLDQVDTTEAVGRIVAYLRRFRPQVVLTFAPDGAYGHPDHIAVSQLATTASLCAADPSFPSAGGGEAPSHRISKLYYMAWSRDAWEIYQAAFKTLTSTVDGVVRQAVPWQDWAITTRVDARPWWQRVWRAVQCHRTQMSVYGALADLTEERQAALWGNQTYYRALSSVNGGGGVETDLFEGVPSPAVQGVPG